MAKQDYIEALREALWKQHHCWSHHIYTAHVRETFQGKIVWEGDVEVFGISGNSKTRRAYGWTQIGGPADENTRFVTVLAISPVDSPEAAVRIAKKLDFKASQSQSSS